MWITSKNKKSGHARLKFLQSKNLGGFTLIELLVVIAIIGILTTVTVVTLTSARRRARDTKRVADIQQMRSALLLYANTRAAFPEALVDGISPVGGVKLGDNAKCLDDNGFHDVSTCTGTKIMERVPKEQSLSTPYTYTRETGAYYTIGFQLEGPVGDLNVVTGLCTADESVIKCN